MLQAAEEEAPLLESVSWWLEQEEEEEEEEKEQEEEEEEEALSSWVAPKGEEEEQQQQTCAWPPPSRRAKLADLPEQAGGRTAGLQHAPHASAAAGMCSARIPAPHCPVSASAPSCAFCGACAAGPRKGPNMEPPRPAAAPEGLVKPPATTGFPLPSRRSSSLPSAEPPRPARAPKAPCHQQLPGQIPSWPQ